MQAPEPVPTLVACRPEFAEQARKLALLGATDADLARHFGVPLATLQAWLASVPDFARAIRQGRTLADADVVDALQQLAVGFVHEVVRRPTRTGMKPVTVIRRRRPNKSARNFLLANRQPGEWQQKAPVEAEPCPDHPRGLTRAELDRLMMEGAAARGSTPSG